MLLHTYFSMRFLEPDGVVTFTRQYLSPEEKPKFEENAALLCRFHADSKSLIEEAEGLLQVDFANK